MQTKNYPAQINSLKSLRAEKWSLKRRLKQRESDFKDRAAKLPIEVIKGTVGKVVPFFLNKRVAAITWGIIKGATGLASHKKASNKPHKSMFSSIKQWGFITAAKAVYGMFSK